MPRRGENIYKRKDGRWEARYVKQIMPDGKRIYGSVYAHSYSEVKDKQKKAISELPAVAHSFKNVCLSEIYPLWMAEVKLNCKPNTIMKYEGVYRNHINLIKSIPVQYIDRKVVNSLVSVLCGKGLCNKTVNDILMVLNKMLKYTSEEYGVNIPKIKYLREEGKEPRVLSVYEQKRFTDYLKKDTDIHKFGTLLALYTGMRIGELCALKWEDISENSICIDKTMERIIENGKSRVVIQPPKSKSSIRTIPFPLELIKYYNKFKGRGYILSTAKIDYTEPRYLQMIFGKYVADSSLTDVTFHTLRHTFATRCIEAGVDAKTVSELLGHSDTKITLNRYVHSSFELKEKSIEKMQKLLA